MLNHLQPDLQVGLQQNCSAILLKTEKIEKAAIIHDDQPVHVTNINLKEYKVMAKSRPSLTWKAYHKCSHLLA